MIRPWLVVAVFLCVASAAQAAPQARFAEPWKRCNSTGTWQCAEVDVPLDWSGRRAGKVRLAVARRHKPGAPRPAVLGLAGGPGQSAIYHWELFRDSVLPALSDHDLLLVDQRGTGQSQPLSCPRIQSTGVLYPRYVKRCAQRLGRRARYYSTADTVRDLEAVRRLSRAPKLTLYGISYGTKVALEYARTYPRQVEALLLDSIVSTASPDLFLRDLFAPVPRVLGQLCAQPSCQRVTPDPVQDLAAVSSRIRARGKLKGFVYGRNKRQAVRIGEAEILSLLLAGDFEPELRTRLPGVLRSAAEGDPQPITRLGAGLVGPSHQGELVEFSAATYLATTCADQDLPWKQAASDKRRRVLLDRLWRQQPRDSFLPFSARLGLTSGDGWACRFWPWTRPARPARPLPDVPALLLSGEIDLRTPLEAARLVAAQLPQSTLVVAPSTGHDVLHSEPDLCGARAVRHFFTGRPINSRCQAMPPDTDMRVEEKDPARLETTPPEPGSEGVIGQTLSAARLSMRDLSRHHEYNSDIYNSRFGVGGLRGGWITRLKGGRLRLHNLQYVQGVRLNGIVRMKEVYPSGVVRISGRGAQGRLRFDSETVSGELDGQPVSARSLQEEDRQIEEDAYRQQSPSDPSDDEGRSADADADAGAGAVELPASTPEAFRPPFL